MKAFEALASGDTLELRIYGPIGAGLFGDGVTALSIADSIKYANPYKRIVAKFNSPGGNAFEGMAIRAILASQDVETVAEIQGLAASAASIAAMGCKQVQMHVGTALMIHEARGSSMDPMDAKELQKMAAALEALNDGMASIYADKTGMTKANCRKMMADETWLTADQAVAKGFASCIVGDTEDATAMKVAASFDLSKFGYAHVPDKFKADANGGGKDVDEPEDDGEEPVDDPTDPDIAVPPAPDADPRQLPLLPPAPQKDVPQPSAASNAEASDRRKRLDTMTIKLIASAMGLADADESAVVAAVSQQHNFVAEVKALTKGHSFEAVLGAIRGLQESAAQLPVLKAQLAEQDEKAKEQERAAIIAADKAAPEGRKLTPAMEEFWAKQPLETFKGWYATAPHVVKVENASTNKGQQQPAAKSGSNTGTEVLTHNGKPFEAMSGSERAALFHEDRERYDALQANHAERGSPRAQAAQQRASA